MAVRRPIRLLRQWPRHVKSGIILTISLASVVLCFARGHTTGRSWLQAKLKQAEPEISLRREELSIHDGLSRDPSGLMVRVAERPKARSSDPR